MDYKRQTREVNFTRRVVDDGTSSRLFETDKKITKRDQNFIRDDKEASKDFENALAFWDKIADRPYQERVDFWDKVSPTIKQFASKDVWDIVKFKQDADFDREKKNLANESPIEKAQRRALFADVIAQQDTIDFSRISLAQWAKDNGHQEYAALLTSMPRGGGTAVILELIKQEKVNLNTNLKNAINGNEPIYVDPFDPNKKFSGNEIYSKQNPAAYLEALVEQETQNFYTLASGGKKYNRTKIAEYVDEEITPIIDLFKVQTLSKITSSNAGTNINNQVSKISTILTNATVERNGVLEFARGPDNKLVKELENFFKGLPQDLTSLHDLKGTSSDIVGASNTSIAMGINRWIVSQPDQDAARDLINEALGQYDRVGVNGEMIRSSNTLLFLDKTTNKMVSFAEKWPGVFGVNGNWHTVSINGQTIQGSESGSSALGDNTLNSSSGKVDLNSGVNSNSQEVFASESGFTIASDRDYHGGKSTYSLTVDNKTEEVPTESVFVYDENNQLQVNSKFAGTFKGKMADFIIKGEPVPPELLEAALNKLNSTTGIHNNIKFRTDIIDFANSNKTTFATTAFLKQALLDPSKNIIVNKKIRKGDILKHGLNNNAAMKFLKDNDIKIVDYMVGDGNDGDVSLSIDTSISGALSGVQFKNSGFEAIMSTALREEIIKRVEADTRITEKNADEAAIVQEHIDVVLKEFSDARTLQAIGSKWYVSDSGDISSQLTPKGWFGRAHQGNIKKAGEEFIQKKVNQLRATDTSIINSDVFSFTDLNKIQLHIAKHNGLPEFVMEAFTSEGLNPYTGYKQYVENFNRNNPNNKIELSQEFQTLLELGKKVDGATLHTILKLKKNNHNQRVSNVALAREVDLKLTQNIVKQQPWSWLQDHVKFRIPRSQDLVAALGTNDYNFIDNRIHGDGNRQLGKHGFLESDIKEAYARVGKKWDEQAFLNNEDGIQETIATNIINTITKESYNATTYVDGIYAMPALLRTINRRRLLGADGTVDEKLESVINNQNNFFIYNVNVNYSGGGVRPRKLGLDNPRSVSTP